MGATTFMVSSKGETAADAFKAAVQEARYLYGNSGYSGTIAEKNSFVVVGKATTTQKAGKMANKMIDASDPRVDDKWGPAGCIECKGGLYVFFGWTSC